MRYANTDAVPILDGNPDVVEVVRCKGCKHWKALDDGFSWHNRGRTDGECEMLWKYHNAERHLTEKEHFCGYAERREK